MHDSILSNPPDKPPTSGLLKLSWLLANRLLMMPFPAPLAGESAGLGRVRRCPRSKRRCLGSNFYDCERSR